MSREPRPFPEEGRKKKRRAALFACRNARVGFRKQTLSSRARKAYEILRRVALHTCERRLKEKKRPRLERRLGRRRSLRGGAGSGTSRATMPCTGLGASARCALGPRGSGGTARWWRRRARRRPRKSAKWPNGQSDSAQSLHLIFLGYIRSTQWCVWESGCETGAFDDAIERVLEGTPRAYARSSVRDGEHSLSRKRWFCLSNRKRVSTHEFVDNSETEPHS